jgi:hypothetical protein
MTGVCPQALVGSQKPRGVSAPGIAKRRLVNPPGCHLLRHPALVYVLAQARPRCTSRTWEIDVAGATKLEIF